MACMVVFRLRRVVVCCGVWRVALHTSILNVQIRAGSGFPLRGKLRKKPGEERGRKLLNKHSLAWW